MFSKVGFWSDELSVIPIKELKNLGYLQQSDGTRVKG